jgi:hypothetical protein
LLPFDPASPPAVAASGPREHTRDGVTVPVFGVDYADSPYASMTVESFAFGIYLPAQAAAVIVSGTVRIEAVGEDGVPRPPRTVSFVVPSVGGVGLPLARTPMQFVRVGAEGVRVRSVRLVVTSPPLMVGTQAAGVAIDSVTLIRHKK